MTGRIEVSTAELARVLADSAYFVGVTAADFDAIADDLTGVGLEDGAVLLDRDDRGDDVFIVLDGSLSVLLDDGDASREVARLGAGSVVGEMTFLTGARRSATVRAATPARVVRVASQGFGALLDSRPAVAAALADEADRRLVSNALSTDLSLLFGDLDDAQRRVIEETLEWVQIPAGDALFTEGDPADAAYFVVFGRVRLIGRRPGGDEVILGEAGRGSMIGGRSVLEETTRDITALATRDSYLLRFPRDRFDALADRQPRLMLRVMRAILRDALATAVDREVEAHTTIAVVPAADGIDLDGFVARLAEALGRRGDVETLSGRSVDERLGRAGIAGASGDSPAAIRLTRWLNELESRSRFVLLRTDDEWTGWTARALRQADRVLLVGELHSVSPTKLEAALATAAAGRRTPRTTAVLLRSDGAAPPTGTAAWLEERAVDDIVHVGGAGDVERLARTLSGEGVALVLSGGGARGLGHLGVMRALAEVGVPVDAVAGTSMGAIMAAMLAYGLPVDELIHEAARRLHRILDYTLPTVSMAKGKRATRELTTLFGEAGIEDLALPFFCVSTSLTRARPVVHRRGPLVQALRASSAIPGVFPPVPFGDELLVDGGTLNNLPADVMRTLHPELQVVAIDVSPPIGPHPRRDFGLWMSGARAFGSRLLRRHPGPPGLADTLMRSTWTAAMHRRDEVVADSVADLYVHLDLRGVSLFEFGSAEHVAQRAYDAALPRIAEWAASRVR